jgi:hypothetical protein
MNKDIDPFAAIGAAIEQNENRAKQPTPAPAVVPVPTQLL